MTDKDEAAQDTPADGTTTAPGGAQRGPAADDREGGPGKIDQTGAGSGRVPILGVDGDTDEQATDRGAGKDGPTPNPAQIAP